MILQVNLGVIYGMYIVTMVLMIVPAVHLLIRGLKLRLYYLLLLSLTFVLFILTYVLAYVVEYAISTPKWVRGLFSFDYPITLIFFTRRVYYSRRKSAFKFVLAITVMLKVVHFLFVTLFDFKFPLPSVLPANQMFHYQVYILISCIMVWLPFGWLARASYKAYRATLTGDIDSWVKKRNLLLVIASSIFIIIPAAYYIAPPDGTGYQSLGGFISATWSSSLILSSSFVWFLCWLIPDWLKKLLGERPSSTMKEEIESATDYQDKVFPHAQKIMNNKEVLMVIDHIGNELAKTINKSPGAVKGLLIIAIDAEIGDFGMYALKLDDLVRVLKGGVRERLKILGINDATTITNDVVETLIKEQSILTMMQA
ncbi:MAG: hypothetical protein ACTSUE_00870 [Promethearchaeota archaeon]